MIRTGWKQLAKQVDQEMPIRDQIVSDQAIVRIADDLIPQIEALMAMLEPRERLRLLRRT
jgi:hypothetical protein